MTPFAVAYLITAVVALILFVWSCLKTQNIKLITPEILRKLVEGLR